LELDWSEEKLNQKLFRVAQVISESAAGCPDVVILQEVENEKILKRLNTMLPCDYQSTAISDDRDARGIDVAVFSKYKIKSVSTKSIPFSKLSPEVLKDTRGLLDVRLSVNEKIIRVLGLHLPAPFHPVQMRKEALQFLEASYFKEVMPTVIAGDWNIPDKEDIEFKMMNALRKSFTLSEDVVRSTSSDLGSTYYAKEGTWSFMDKIALSRNAFDRVECKVVNFLPGQRGEKVGEPQSFPLGKKLEAGVSDHFPIFCKSSY
jgi:endonuclease/exonuclease/phosphatase family metal-dependent hydrolase